MSGRVPASPQRGTSLIDEFLRRELRVGDPKSATEVATALHAYYAEYSLGATQVAWGFRVSPSIDTTPSGADRNALGVASDTETSRADSALRADFEALIGEPANRERGAEFEGWRPPAWST